MIRRFTDGDVDTAAELLAERHARHRQIEPLLPSEVDFRRQIESEWGAGGASGVISRDGYLFARPLAYAGGGLTSGSGEDLELAARLDQEMRDSMVPAPSFSEPDSWTHEQYVDDWRGTWDEDQYVHFVAERDDRMIGQILLYKRSHDLRVPVDSIDLASASTFPAERGSGAGRALTEHVLHWARTSMDIRP
jgi:hypothetical protein